MLQHNILDTVIPRWSSKKNGKRLAAVGRQGILCLFDLDEAW